MANFVSNKDESVRMFKSPFLEWFTHIHPVTPIILYLPVITYFLYRSFSGVSVMATFGMFAIGLLSWTLLEYILHRFVFHYEPKTAFGKKIHFFTHGVHHDYPRDSTRLVMTPSFSLPIGVAVYFLFNFLYGIYASGAIAGIVTGYVAYDTIHFATHHLPLNSRLGRFLKQYHMKHHYTDGNRSFGVSTPLWDYVFRTAPKRTTIHETTTIHS